MTVLPCPLLSALLVRTDFTRFQTWESTRATVSTSNVGGFLADIVFVDDAALAGLATEDVVGLLPAGREHPLLVVADAETLASPELPLLVVRVRDRARPRVRVVAERLWSIENNLALANMDAPAPPAPTMSSSASAATPEYGRGRRGEPASGLLRLQPAHNRLAMR